MRDIPQPYVRLWDNEMRLLYSSRTDPRTPGEFMRDQMMDECRYSKDYGQGYLTRDSGFVRRVAGDDEHLVWDSAREFLHRITYPPTTLPGTTPGGGTE